MYNFTELEEIYENIASLEKALKEFSPYAVYELEGGFELWCNLKRQILHNIARQKELLLKIAEKCEEITEEQRQKLENWKAN